jgi:hypothetical protein
LVEILRLHLIPDGKLTHHLLWFIVLVLHGRSINQAHERMAFRLSSTTHNSKCCFLENKNNDDDDDDDNIVSIETSN